MKEKAITFFLVSVVSSVSTGRAARAGEHLQNSANFEVTDLGQFLIVVELFGDHESGRCEVHFDRTNMLMISPKRKHRLPIRKMLRKRFKRINHQLNQWIKEKVKH